MKGTGLPFLVFKMSDGQQSDMVLKLKSANRPTYEKFLFS